MCVCVGRGGGGGVMIMLSFCFNKEISLEDGAVLKEMSCIMDKTVLTYNIFNRIQLVIREKSAGCSQFLFCLIQHNSIFIYSLSMPNRSTTNFQTAYK